MGFREGFYGLQVEGVHVGLICFGRVSESRAQGFLAQGHCQRVMVSSQFDFSCEGFKRLSKQFRMRASQRLSAPDLSSPFIQHYPKSCFSRPFSVTNRNMRFQFPRPSLKYRNYRPMYKAYILYGDSII